MPKFLIEVPHEAGRLPCLRAIKEFLNSGSHFVANAEWGCKDGDHRAWVVADVDSKDEARLIVPPMYRDQANVIELNRFTLHEIEAMYKEHAQ